jgi:hypothetical protein
VAGPVEQARDLRGSGEQVWLGGDGRILSQGRDSVDF